MKSAGAGGARPAAGYARLGRGSLPPAEPEKNGPLAARAPGFSRWENALFGCVGACHAGGCGPGNGKMAANEKRGRRRGPVSQQDVRGLGAAACRPPGLGENGPLAARAPGFSRWESALFGCAGARRAGGCGPGNDKMAANEKRGRRRALSRSGMCAAWARQLAAQTAASKGRGFFFHGRKFGRGVESLFYF